MNQLIASTNGEPSRRFFPQFLFPCPHSLAILLPANSRATICGLGTPPHDKPLLRSTAAMLWHVYPGPYPGLLSLARFAGCTSLTVVG